MLCCGCGILGRHGPAAVARLLKSDEGFYQSVAEQWLNENNPGMFCNFDDGNYRWNDSFITRNGAQYEVEKDGIISRFAAFNEAASAAGVAPDHLSQWINKARQGHIYCVDTKRNSSRADERYVEILLEGAGFDPYGLRYAPSQPAYDYLENFAKQNGTNMDYAMEHLQGKWFYFCSRR